MAKKRNTDWDGALKDYAAGIIPVREICRRYDIDPAYLTRKARESGVKRDLGTQVKLEVKKRLLHGNGAKGVRRGMGKLADKGQKDEDDFEQEVIESSAEEIVKVIKFQRRDVKNLRLRARELMLELKNEPHRILRRVVNKGKENEEIVYERVPLGTPEKTEVLLKISKVLEARTKIENQIYQISQGKSLDEEISEKELEDKLERVRALLSKAKVA
jgi:hypothetical protein